MEEALTALLLADAGLGAHVGNRVHWMRQPGSVAVRPYVNLQNISDQDFYHSKGRADLGRARVQVDIWGETYGQAKLAMRALRAVLSGYQGVFGGVNFRSIMLDQVRDLTDQNAGGETQLFRLSADFTINWKQGA